MRAPRIKVRSGKKKKLKERQKTACVLRKKQTCTDDLIFVFHVTRSVTKFMNEFILYETYRCMPLLGNEKDNAPDWEVHIARAPASVLSTQTTKTLYFAGLNNVIDFHLEMEAKTLLMQAKII